MFVFTSCEEEEKVDPALQAKYERQKALLEKNQLELDELRARIEKVKVPDPTADLNEVKKGLAEATLEKNKLESEIASLEAKKRSAEEDLLKYKKKYPIRE